jgi:hypothetical protein
MDEIRLATGQPAELRDGAEPSAEAIIAADRIESLDVFTSDRWTERRELTAHARSVIAFALDAFAARKVAEAVATERQRIARRVSERVIVRLSVGRDPLVEVNEVIQDLAYDIATNWEDYE